ncbi:MAG TPA: alpha/beta hydrolase [Devosiaceae bacterium]
MKLLRRLLIGVVALVVVAYVGVLAYIYFNQRALEYFPNGEITQLAATPLTGATMVAIPTTDGATVNGWYQAASAGKPVILYYKGNSGSFSEEHERYEAFVKAGYGFLAFDYRGFPESPGEITQQHVLDDSVAAFDWLKAKGQPIVIWGRSLGTGPATYVAGLRQADALLLETPFLSAVTVAFERYPFLPVGLLMDDQFPVNDWIKKVDEPVFIAHGTADQTIGVSNGQRLYQMVPHKYDLWIVEGADHGDLWARGIWDKAQTFFSDAEAGSGR